MVLSQRLSQIAAYYHGAPSIWDIGCDHGQLGLSFLTRPEVQTIHLVDPSSLVIQTLQQKLKDSDIPRREILQIHHQKGQEIRLKTALPKCLFIAGMGGKEIQDILVHLIPQLGVQDRLVISPHRKILELRSFLQDSELRLYQEESLLEDDQFYQLLCLGKDPSLPRVTPFGVGIWQGEVGESYRQHQLRHFSLHRDPVSRAYVAYLEAL